MVLVQNVHFEADLVGSVLRNGGLMGSTRCESRLEEVCHCTGVFRRFLAVVCWGRRVDKVPRVEKGAIGAGTCSMCAPDRVVEVSVVVLCKLRCLNP